MNRKMTAGWIGLFSLVLIGLLGCVGPGYRGGGFGGSRDTLRGEVKRADMRYHSIMIDTGDRARGEVSVYHTDRTRVSYRDRPYPVGDIEAGDYIEVETRDPRQENPTADSIIVIRKSRR
jgi:hypothetical protein